ncbi:MAG: hypothetical protein COC04_06530 [Gammaproteobacteria bacterium]|nr:MAG: hypothetical protein COC04_06530 [Gammaproteobacteria bacterium]
MIKYNLKCHNSHIFEAWFKNSGAYDVQKERNVISCALCGSNEVEKAIMAPSLPKKGNSGAAATKETQEAEAKQVGIAMNALKEIRKTVEENCDYVGNQFAEEARKIHYGETDNRGIYGEATEDERAELSDEGVDVAALPWLPTSDA